jgi:hypothetical protein
LETILQELKDIKNQNRRIIATNGDEIEHMYPPLPLKSPSELEETEQIILDAGQFQKLVKILQWNIG